MNAINKRKRASSGKLSQQKIRAYSSIYHSPNTTSSSRTYTGSLDGKILKCPKKKDQFWVVKWSSNLTSRNETIPPIQLRKIIPNNQQNKKLLLDAVLLFSPTTQSSTSNTSTNVSTPSDNHVNLNTSSDTSTVPLPTNDINHNHNRNTVTATNTTSTTNTTPDTNPTPVPTINTNHTTATTVNSTPQRASIHDRFTSICGNIELTSQTTPNNTEDNISHQSFWEFESDPDGWVNRNSRPAATSLTSLMEQADDNDVEVTSLSSGEDDVPNAEFSLPDETSFIPREETDEFPDHEADDALVDEIQQELEREVNLPNLPFKFEEWNEELHSLDQPPIMSPLHTTFHPNLDKTQAFNSTKACFEHITGLDLYFFLHVTRIMNEFGERNLDQHGRFANTKWKRFEIYEIYRCIGIILRSGFSSI